VGHSWRVSCLPKEGGRTHAAQGWVVGEKRSLEMGMEGKNVMHLKLGWLNQIDLESNMI